MSSPSISALTAGNSFSAATQALTKNDMKPRRTPSCFFSNASRYSARSVITADMSTSLKVVNIAAVFCASFRRAAMVRRRRVMRTRSSRGSASRGGFAARAGAATVTGRSRNASTSPLVMRPSLPLPGPICTGDRCCSSISLAAAGITSGCVGGVAGRVTGPSGRGGGCTPAGGLAAARGAGAGCATLGCAGLAGADAPASSTASRAPTGTSLPSGATIELSTPAVGAPTSTVTLSVSNSTSGSSAATASPSCFIHRATVAEVTLSPSVGTLISVAMSGSPQRRGHQRRLLDLVHARRSGRRARRRLATRIGRAPRLAVKPPQHLLDPPIDEAPGAHVLRLLLAPHHIGVAVRRQQAAQGVFRERVGLLQPQNGDVVDTAGLTFRQQIVIHLAAADHHAAHQLGRGDRFGFRDDELEAALAQLGQSRYRQLVPEQRLGGEYHRGLAEIAVQLPAQRMEIARRRGRVAHPHVPLGA